MSLHTIDRNRIRTELDRRGWRMDAHGCWVRPRGMTNEQAENDWLEAIVCGIKCQLEDRQLLTIRQLEKETVEKERRRR